jgi:hypothetical protein
MEMLFRNRACDQCRSPLINSRIHDPHRFNGRVVERKRKRCACVSMAVRSRARVKSLSPVLVP